MLYPAASNTTSTSFVKATNKHCAGSTIGSSYTSLSLAQSACEASSSCTGVYDASCNGNPYLLCGTSSFSVSSSQSCVYKKTVSKFGTGFVSTWNTPALCMAQCQELVPGTSSFFMKSAQGYCGCSSTKKGHCSITASSTYTSYEIPAATGSGSSNIACLKNFSVSTSQCRLCQPGRHLTNISQLPVVIGQELGWEGCTSSNPCSVGQGDCDNDSECAGGLKCFRRSNSVDLPQNFQNGNLVAGSDMCYDPNVEATDGGCGECSVGHFCVGGTTPMQPCSAGTYGSTTLLTTDQCSGTCIFGRNPTPGSTTSSCGGICPEGFVCKARSIVACGSARVFCPAGSTKPTAVADRHYSTPETAPANQRSGEAICPDGHVCSDGMKRFAPEGYFIAAGGIQATPCSQAGSFCPAGSVLPTPVAEGYYTLPRGYFTVKGQGVLRYRTSQMQCEPGYFCVNGIRSQCKDVNVFSTAGQTECQVAQAGHYTFGGYTNPRTQITFRSKGEMICERGHYCLNGKRFKCPPGTFGSTPGLATELCSGRCSQGSICKEGSTSGTGAKCPVGYYCNVTRCGAPQPCGGVELYCPSGSAKPVSVTPGYFTLPNDPTSESTREDQAQCPAGFYCASGRKIACGSAAYYSQVGASACNPVKSTHYSTGDGNGTSHATGERVCPPGSYCTGGIKYLAPFGKFIAEPGVKARDLAVSCPAGTYGNQLGLKQSDCSGLCAEGHYCPAGSVSATPFTCGGAASYCPSGSGTPKAVSSGYYSTPEKGNSANRTSQEVCKPGYYCKRGERVRCGKDKPIPFRWYCPADELSEPQAMAPGYYGTGGVEGNKTLTLASPCEPGFFCTEGTRKKCGGSSVYCVSKSFSPQRLNPGWFSTGGDSKTRTGEEKCPPGFYCQGGEQLSCKLRDIFFPRNTTCSHVFVLATVLLANTLITVFQLTHSLTCSLNRSLVITQALKESMATV
jgi:hypothetical protein